MTSYRIQKSNVNNPAGAQRTLHFAALPLSLWRPGRKYFLIAVLLFHASVLCTPLYYVSLGMFPFWLYLVGGIGAGEAARAPAEAGGVRGRNQYPGIQAT